jgi:arginine decarboxylase
VSLPLHAPKTGESYRLGIFLVGAYQEALGDIHNLFGDTDAVNVRAADGGFTFSHVRRGDTTDVMLDYVGYDLNALREAYREKIVAAKLSSTQADSIANALEQGLTGYTYLAEHDEG